MGSERPQKNAFWKNTKRIEIVEEMFKHLKELILGFIFII
jgi:hypothetical protein